MRKILLFLVADLLILTILFFGAKYYFNHQTPAKIVSKSYLDPDSLTVFMGMRENNQKEFKKVFDYCSSHHKYLGFWGRKNCNMVDFVHEYCKKYYC
jgi:hypothetical protein